MRVDFLTNEEHLSRRITIRAIWFLYFFGICVRAKKHGWLGNPARQKFQPSLLIPRDSLIEIEHVAEGAPKLFKTGGKQL